ncbi:MAG: Fur family transcriptional regulator [Flavobacteriales bacterium]
MKDVKKILSKSGLNKTKFRVNLLAFFYSSKKSLSIEEILQNFNHSVDRVTVYRCLESFEKKGLIHSVPDNNNLKRYSVCMENCNTNAHHHNHGHFICYSCDQTFCLDNVKTPEITSIDGFMIKEISLTAEGFCQNCITQ